MLDMTRRRWPSTSMTTSLTPTASSRRASLLAQQVAVLEQDLAGGGVRHGLDQLVAGHPLPQGQLLVELVAAHGGQVVAPGVKEQVVEQGLGGVHRGGLAGTELAVDLQHGVLIGLAGVLLQGGYDAGIVAERLQDLRVGLEAQGPDQAGDGQLAVLVDADPEHLVGVGLILQPGAPVGDDRGGEDGQVGLDVRSPCRSTRRGSGRSGRPPRAPRR